MTVLAADRAQGLHALVGRELEPSRWILFDQRRIDTFTDSIGDDEWIHVASRLPSPRIPRQGPRRRGERHRSPAETRRRQ